MGLAVTFLLVAITEYYTGTRWSPVKSIARASRTGHATNIIEGLAVGMQSTAAPVIVIAAGILVANEPPGVRDRRRRPMAQLSMTGLVVALDAYGPVTDNAGGIARWPIRRVSSGDHRPARRRRQHDQGRDQGVRDRLGGPRRALLFDSYTEGLSNEGITTTFRPQRSVGIVGLRLGGLMPFLFASLAMQAVGQVGGQVVVEVRRQSRSTRGSWIPERPDSAGRWTS